MDSSSAFNEWNAESRRKTKRKHFFLKKLLKGGIRKAHRILLPVHLQPLRFWIKKNNHTIPSENFGRIMRICEALIYEKRLYLLYYKTGNSTSN
jgi:hypothetical protein